MRDTRTERPVGMGAPAALAAMLRRPRYEVIALPGVDELVGEWAPRDCTVTVTATPRLGLEQSVALTERLARAGYRAVPHLTARQIADEAHLAEILSRLAAVGVGEAFVIGGDADAPVGRFEDALSVLTAMSQLPHSLVEVGIAGYPEGHPFLSVETLGRALRAKAPLATYTVTQMCFDPAAVSAWVERLGGQGVALPVHVGVVGAVDRRRLLRVASRIGVGQSARFLSKHRRPLARLLSPRGYRPDRLLRRLAPDLARPGTPIAGLHIYTLNDLGATERWRRRTVERLEETR